MKTIKQTFDDSIILKKKTKMTTDKYGNPVEKYEDTELLCNIKSIDRNQFFNAGMKGYKLAYAVSINEFEYEDEEKAELKGKSYEIIRTYLLGDGLIELTLGEKIGDSE